MDDRKTTSRGCCAGLGPRAAYVGSLSHALHCASNSMNEYPSIPYLITAVPLPSPTRTRKPQWQKRRIPGTPGLNYGPRLKGKENKKSLKTPAKRFRPLPPPPPFHWRLLFSAHPTPLPPSPSPLHFTGPPRRRPPPNPI